VPLVKATTSLIFSWANTSIDPNTDRLPHDRPGGWGASLDVKVLSVVTPPNEGGTCVTVSAVDSGSAPLRIATCSANLTKSFKLPGRVASHDERRSIDRI